MLMLLLLFFVDGASVEKANEVKSILDKMERDVVEFREVMRESHAKRCAAQTLSKCAGSNFYDCSSRFPNQLCVAADELVVSACLDSNGTACSGWWDKSTTLLSIPAPLANGGHLTDPELIETACYGLLAEPYMVEKYKRDEQYWAKYGIHPSYTYYAAHNGLFRQIPGRHQKQCGAYDPRKRPWFVAASTGPKDVVLVIDISDSMNKHGRLRLAKEAAITIVNTTSVGDYLTIITFSDTAAQIGGYDSLIRATTENKERLVEAINGLEANGGTNFYDAFELAYSSLEKSIPNDKTTLCNAAILFLTDGGITRGPGRDEVINLVNERTRQFAKNDFGRKALVFTYSLGDSADHDVMKTIACNTNGIWTPVDDDYNLSGDLVTAMSSYYKLFALGLGEGRNEDFVAWVEPYEFATTGNVGTTVSTPLYDYSVSPPLFLGVVAIDMYMSALEEVLGEDSFSSTMLDRFIELSTASCPRIEMSECELDALRYLGGGKESTCGVCNRADCAGIVPEKCQTQGKHPKNLWDNTEMEGMNFTMRGCCSIAGSFSSDICPSTLSDTPVQSQKTPSFRNALTDQETIEQTNPPLKASFCASLPADIHSYSAGKSNYTSLMWVIVVLTIALLAMCLCFWKKEYIMAAIEKMKNGNIKSMRRGLSNAGTNDATTEGGVELPRSVSFAGDASLRHSNSAKDLRRSSLEYGDISNPKDNTDDNIRNMDDYVSDDYDGPHPFRGRQSQIHSDMNNEESGGAAPAPAAMQHKDGTTQQITTNVEDYIPSIEELQWRLSNYTR